MLLKALGAEYSFTEGRYYTAHRDICTHPCRSETLKESDSVYLVRDLDETPAKRGMEAIITDVFDDGPQVAYNISLSHDNRWGAVNKNDIQKEKIEDSTLGR